MDELRRSTLIFRELWGALAHDRELLFFPIVTAILAGVGLFLAIFGIPAEGLFSEGAGGVARALRFALLAHVATWFVGVFFGAAVLRCTQVGLEGGAPTIADGLLAALRCVHRLLAWAVVASTIGLVLRVIERGGGVRRLDVAIENRLGASWTHATFFVLPAIIVDGLGLRRAIERSRGAVFAVWGDAFARRCGIGPAVEAAALAALLLPLAGLLFGAAGARAGLALAIAGAVVLGALATALHAMHLAVLYDYAKTGELADGVAEALAPVPAGAH